MVLRMRAPGEHCLRIGRWSEPGRVYLLTFATANRRPLFRDWSLAAPASAVIGVCATWHDGRLLAWVLMPDHCHVLVEVGAIVPLSTLVARAKAKSARCVGRARGGLGRIWQRGYHDHAVRREEDLVDFARYVVANPLRAGLVRRLGDYPYWNAIWFGGQR